MTQQEIDTILDQVNALKLQLKDIEEENRKLKRSRQASVGNIKKANSTIEVERVAIQYFDTKVENNTQRYYDISDELKAVDKKLKSLG